MSNTLDDGSVIPSFYTMAPIADAKSMMHSVVTLKSGVVSHIYYPDEDTNISKKSIEYDVVVANSDIRNGLNLSVFRNCKVNNLFGNTNNSLNFTLQPGQKEKSGIVNKGSAVLILCIEGISDAGSAIIIGGLDAPNSKIYKKEDGQFYDFNFNGINYNINKDGELSIKFDSVIDVDGKKANEAASGTILKFDKDGGYTVSDNEGQSFSLSRKDKISTWTNGKESITIDKANKKISLNSSGELDTSSDAKTAISSKDDISASAQKNIDMSAQNDVKVKASGNILNNAGSNMTESIGANWTVNVGGNMILQSSGIAQIQGSLTQIGAGALPIGAVGVSMSVGTNGGGPMVSVMLTGSTTCLVGT